jgi:NADH-quinone oxidoreductase subunit A
MNQPIYSVLLFAITATAFLAVNLLVGRLLRPRLPGTAKSTAYECGELPVGGSWVQFDFRIYIVALVYLVFAVEVVLFYPWAVYYGSADAIASQSGQTALTIRLPALIAVAVFIVIVTVGFGYLWKMGYLDWVRSSSRQS